MRLSFLRPILSVTTRLSLACALATTFACADDEDDGQAEGTDTAATMTESGGTATDATATAGDTHSDSTHTESTGDSNTDGTTDGTDSDPSNPAHYEFQSRFVAGSSVSYSGQIFRHVLINDLTKYLEGLTALVDGDFVPANGDIIRALDFYYRFDDATAGSESHLVSTTPATLQVTYADISSGKDLSGKIAGNDPEGQHLDWSTGLVGWEEVAGSPEAVVQAWFAAVEKLAIDRANGTIPLDPSGAAIPSVVVDAQGRDYRQLIQKFLLGAIAFSQGADDYLDDSLEGKGILADNTVPAGEGAAYTALEHAWDEGFGYFGAAVDYIDYSDEELAAKGGRPEYASGYHDQDADGRIDLLSEYNFGHCLNAAKRDLGSSAVAPTDFSGAAISAFVDGRRLITTANGALSAEQLAMLQQYRDTAIANWEMAIAATVVHYINDVLQDMHRFGTAEYDFLAHAKHWSELKGFALSFQFNPRSKMSKEQQAQFHQAVGTAPVLATSPDVEAYKTALRNARALLGTAYAFAPENLGDANGENGW